MRRKGLPLDGAKRRKTADALAMAARTYMGTMYRSAPLPGFLKRPCCFSVLFDAKASRFATHSPSLAGYTESVHPPRRGVVKHDSPVMRASAVATRLKRLFVQFRVRVVEVPHKRRFVPHEVDALGRRNVSVAERFAV